MLVLLPEGINPPLYELCVSFTTAGVSPYKVVGVSHPPCELVEINPCETKNGGCQHRCHYQNKAVTCECEPGYVLHSNGRSCKEINPCKSGNGGCQQKCFFKDKRVKCGCKSGFELLPDGRNCR
ncbi:hypothetical protein CDAR_235851, partial [Caerostris darwini]